MTLLEARPVNSCGRESHIPFIFHFHDGENWYTRTNNGWNLKIPKLGKGETSTNYQFFGVPAVRLLGVGKTWLGMVFGDWMCLKLREVKPADVIEYVCTYGCTYPIGSMGRLYIYLHERLRFLWFSCW